MNDDELRRLGPDGLSPDRHRALRDQLLATIAADEAEPTDGILLDEPPLLPASTSRRPRAIPALVAAAAVLVAVALAAVLAGRPAGTGPDEAELGATTTVPAPLDDRPPLATQHIPCIMSTPERSRSIDLAAPPDEPLDPATMIEACEAAVVDLRSGVAAPGVACRTVDDAVPTAVVVLVGADCSLKGYADLTGDDLAALEEVRAFEASLWAIPSRCPTRDELEAWMADRLDGSDVDAELVPAGDGNADGCWQPAVDWVAGTITAVPAS